MSSTYPTSIRLDKKIYDKINKITKVLPISKSTFIKEAINQKADDLLEYLELIERAKDAKLGKAKIYTMEEIKKKYNIE